MRALGRYHCRDIHEWDEGQVCGFHAKKVCSCKTCDDDEEPKCEGAPYHNKKQLKCEQHHLEYQIECERREDADNIIHPKMGRAHSNLCEAHFTVLPKFRAKDQSLCRF